MYEFYTLCICVFPVDNTFVPALKVPYEEFSGRSQPQVFTPRQYNSQETPDTQILHQPHTLPSSLSPWNVQYTVPFQLPSANPSSNIWMVTPDCLSGQGLPSSLLRSGATMAQVHAIPVHNRLPKTNRGQSKVSGCSSSSGSLPPRQALMYDVATHLAVGPLPSAFHSCLPSSNPASVLSVLVFLLISFPPFFLQ